MANRAIPRVREYKLHNISFVRPEEGVDYHWCYKNFTSFHKHDYYEFIIITDKSEEGLAEEVTKAIKDEVDKIDFRDDFDIKISLGTTLYDGVTPISELLDNADKKMYEAKRKG